ncbi:MAG TPA: hypothetical protein VNH46_00425, partial [Gemmatimonadales bacterium]|nr:hypothetical protein [Gemmatimonadales bacterium]
MISRYPKRLFAGMAFALALAGAGPAAAQQTGKQHNACTLLTPTQVGHAIGVAVGAGSPIGTTG